MLSASVFDNTGKPYDVSRILTADFVFDQDAYQRYSRVFMPITYVLSYALQFASLTALLTHTVCFHGRDIWRQSYDTFASPSPGGKHIYEPIQNDTSHANGQTRRRSSTKVRRPSRPELEDLMESQDVHNRLMKRYTDVPMTWYLCTGIVMTAIGLFVVE